MKFIYIFCAVAFVFFLALAESYGSEYHHHHQPTTNSAQTTKPSGTAIALAASQHTYSYGIKSLQGSFAVGTYEDETAISFGLAKKIDKILINGSVSNERGKLGLGASINFHF